MEFHLWLSLLAICALGALSPGPSLALVVKNTLHGGQSQGIATAISHGIGVGLYALATATGIGIVIVQSPEVFSLVQYAGAAFLLYLGIKALFSKKLAINVDQQTTTQQQVNGWRDGFLVAFFKS